jgi:beta-mannosidase
MYSQSLNNRWQLQYKDLGKPQWIEAHVPGIVYLDLLNNDLIPDPFIGENEKSVQWVSKQDWIYRLIFSLDSAIINKTNKYLRFEGIDTFSDILLNNTQIMATNNMFHPWEVDVSKILLPKNNELIVKLKSPLETAKPIMEKLPYKLPADNDKAGGVSPFIRKAPYHFGWDWGPSLVNMGIWKNVEILGWDSFRSTYITINQKYCDSDLALLETEIHIDSNEELNGLIRIDEERSLTAEKFEINLKPGLNIIHHEFNVFSPELWWPNGYGLQPLYNFHISIEINGSIIKIEKQVGIRSIIINTSSDEEGEKFEINVNGKPIFAKGANWIPADSFQTRVSKHNYNELLSDAINANFNTIRVWGGGIYESNEFYELCDEKGILVWQDFMFACSMYPADKDFLESVKKEVTYQIKRLKHHASIALWCGNNEIGVAWHNWGWKEKLPIKVWEKDYNELFHKLIPNIIEKNDSYRFYWPTSPGFTIDLPSEGQKYISGDNHYWGVWHLGDEFDAFKENIGRFMSEYGMQSFPNIETIKMFCPQNEFDKTSKSITSHQKASLGNKNLEKYLDMYYPEAKDFESFVTLSQIMQSYALKTAIETHRSSMPKCMGTLYWQLNDCWPGISWSTLDYYGNWKASHYEVKRSFEPLILTAIEQNDEIVFYAINDNDIIHSLILIIKTFSFEGKIFNEQKINIDALNYGANQISVMNKQSILNNIDLSSSFLRLELMTDDNCISKKDHFFTEPKNLLLEKPSFNFNYKINNSKIHLQINANTFLYKLHLSCNNHRGVFEDNFFEMLPNEQKIIEFYPNKNEDPLPSSYEFELKTFYELVKR